MDTAELLNLAAGQSRRFLELVHMFFFVATGLLTAVGTFRNSLTRMHISLLAIVGFGAFSVAHGVTMWRSYATFKYIECMLESKSDNEMALNLLESLEPVLADKTAAVCYIASVVGVMVLLFCVWYYPKKKGPAE